MALKVPPTHPFRGLVILVVCVTVIPLASAYPSDSSTDFTTPDEPLYIDPALCQGRTDFTVFLFDEDFSSYYRCENGQIKFESCTGGWVFNSKLYLCDKAVDRQGLHEGGVKTTTDKAYESAENAHNVCLDSPYGTVIPNRKNPQLYYYCRSKGLYYVVSCPLGSFYDPKTNKCGPNVPAQVDTTTIFSPQDHCANEKPGATFALQNDCAKYISCNGNGKYFIMKCPNNNYYNPSRRNCGPSSDRNICNNPAQTTTTTTFTTICNNKYLGQLVPYPDNCQKYISCVRPIPVAFYCPNSYEFNEAQQTCVESVAGTCRGLTEDKITITNVPNDICRGHEKGSIQAYADNYLYYYECLGNDKYMLKACNPGTYVDAVTKLCNSAPHSDSSTDFTTPDEPLYIDPALCQGRTDFTVFLFDEDFSSYYRCENGQIKFESCTGGWVFNSKLYLCDKAVDRQGLHEGGVKTTTDKAYESAENAHNVCLDSPYGTVIPNRKNPQLYYYCRSKGLYYVVSCPLGSFYDPKTNKCGPNVPAQVDTTTIFSPQDHCANEKPGATFALQNDCFKYISCNGNGKYFIMKCPNNNYYNPSRRNCGPSSDRNICNNPAQTTTTTTFTTICNNKYLGQLVPYPDNCQKYISCVRPIPVAFYCPNSYEFNEAQQTCVESVAGTCRGLTEDKITITNVPNDICRGHEKGSIQAYADNYLYYYECLGNDKYMLKACNPGTYVDAVTKLCNSAPHSDSSTDFTTPDEPLYIDPALCQGRTDFTVFLFDEDFSSYYRCENGQIKFESCTGGWVFNSKLYLCDKAVDRQGLHEGGVKTTTDKAYESAENAHNVCLDSPYGTVIPNRKNPQLYYYCRSKGLYYVVSCPLGSFYDPKTNKCGPNVPAQVDTTTIFSPQDHCANEKPGATFALQNDCAKYISCNGNGKYFIMKCPNNNYYNPSRRNCGPSSDRNICNNPAQTTTTTTFTTICNNKYLGQLVPYPDNCQKYISCVRPTPVAFYCPNSYQFNEAQQTCVESVAGTCRGLTEDKITITNVPNDICRGHEKGSIQAYADNYLYYYECLGNDKYMLKACNPGTYFDAVTKVCRADDGLDTQRPDQEGPLKPAT